jgi:hypothetical protein
MPSRARPGVLGELDRYVDEVSASELIELPADGFAEHEGMPGLAPGNEGVRHLSECRGTFSATDRVHAAHDRHRASACTCAPPSVRRR